MDGAQGEGKGTKARGAQHDSVATSDDCELEQIEYLIYQSTQGIHLMFQNSDIERVLRTPIDDKEFFTAPNKAKVQELLSSWLDRPTLSEKRSYLDSLPRDDFELLIRAYFHLVENTILAHSELRH